jgi:hypothetical protein
MGELILREYFECVWPGTDRKAQLSAGPSGICGVCVASRRRLRHTRFAAIVRCSMQYSLVHRGTAMLGCGATTLVVPLHQCNVTLSLALACAQWRAPCASNCGGGTRRGTACATRSSASRQECSATTVPHHARPTLYSRPSRSRPRRGARYHLRRREYSHVSRSPSTSLCVAVSLLAVRVVLSTVLTVHCEYPQCRRREVWRG